MDRLDSDAREVRERWAAAKELLHEDDRQSNCIDVESQSFCLPASSFLNDKLNHIKKSISAHHMIQQRQTCNVSVGPRLTKFQSKPTGWT